MSYEQRAGLILPVQSSLLTAHSSPLKPCPSRYPHSPWTAL